MKAVLVAKATGANKTVVEQTRRLNQGVWLLFPTGSTTKVQRPNYDGRMQCHAAMGAKRSRPGPAGILHQQTSCSHECQHVPAELLQPCHYTDILPLHTPPKPLILEKYSKAAEVDGRPAIHRRTDVPNMRFPLALLSHLSTSGGLVHMLRAVSATAAPACYTGFYSHQFRREQQLVSLRGFGAGLHDLAPPPREPGLPASGGPLRGSAGQRRLAQSLLKLFSATTSSALGRSYASGGLCRAPRRTASDSSRRFYHQRDFGSGAAELYGGSAEAQQAPDQFQAPEGQPADAAAAAAELAAPAKASINADAAAATAGGSAVKQEASDLQTLTFDTPEEEEKAAEKLQQDMDAIMHVRGPSLLPVHTRCYAQRTHEPRPSCHCRLYIRAAR